MLVSPLQGCLLALTTAPIVGSHILVDGRPVESLQDPACCFPCALPSEFCELDTTLCLGTVWVTSCILLIYVVVTPRCPSKSSPGPSGPPASAYLYLSTHFCLLVSCIFCCPPMKISSPKSRPPSIDQLMSAAPTPLLSPLLLL